MKKILFEIKYFPNNTSQSDIQLRIFNIEEILYIDSYYFMDQEDISMDVLNCLKSVLFKWYKGIQQAKINSKPIYLIIDFSDQYFGGFCFKLHKDEEVSLSYGIIRDSYDLNMESVIDDLRGHEFIKLYEYETTLPDLLFTIEENITNLR